MTRQFIIGTLLSLSLALSAVGVRAHHAFAAQFDRDQPVDITGTVTKVEWLNPHARFYMEAPDPDRDGEVFAWNWELASPNNLMRQGWRRDSLKPGDTVSVSGWRARLDPHVANAREVTDASGKQLFAASSAEDE